MYSVGMDTAQKYFPGSAEALTISEASKQIAYCYRCNACRFQTRVDLRLISTRFEPGTLVGDLLHRLPCGQCGDTGKTVMTLWLTATMTARMLKERGYPVWE